MTIDFSPLASAISQLENSIAFATSEMAENDDGLFEQFRNSVIQCFEFTYKLSHKMLTRYLEETAANPEEINLSTFQNIIRVDVVDWATTCESFRNIIEQNHRVNPKQPALAAFANGGAAVRRKMREVSLQRIGAHCSVTSVKKEPPRT